MPDARFVVCGGGGGETGLRRRFEALGMGARVDIRGAVEDIRVPLEEFDIFGYPLAEDTYATSEKALQEAMWVGVPPVVFAHGGRAPSRRARSHRACRADGGRIRARD